MLNGINVSAYNGTGVPTVVGRRVFIKTTLKKSLSQSKWRKSK